MAQNEPLLRSDEQAARALDVHYAMCLRCGASDFHRAGWTITVSRAESDPATFLFERRPLLSLVASLAESGHGRGGVAMVAPELRAPLSAMLRELPPDDLFTVAGLAALDAQLNELVPELLTAQQDAYLRLAYVSQSSFHPYVGEWQEWIEPLDETAEIEPQALSLLARYGGGVYVIRQSRAIVSFAGIRTLSPHVAEIGVRTDALPLRGMGMAQAVVSRATKAVLASGRVPLYRHHPSNAPSERVSRALGYHPYADAVEYFAPAL